VGEVKHNLSASQRLINQFPECCYCGGTRPSTTREHMPPKSLFDNSHRPDGLVMPACAECNRATSTADLVVSLVGRWDYGNSPQENSDHRRLVARLRKQAPELISEWTGLNCIEIFGSRPAKRGVSPGLRDEEPCAEVSTLTHSAQETIT
jgi:hypothetical protein